MFHSAHRLEEAGKQAEQRVDRAEARAADLQHDLHQAEQRAHQVLLCLASIYNPKCVCLDLPVTQHIFVA